MPPASGPDIERYARAAAAAAGLAVDVAWWPSIVRHLEGMLAQAASLETEAVALPEDVAPVFQP